MVPIVFVSLAGVGTTSAWANAPANIVVYSGSNQTAHPGSGFVRALNALVIDSGGAPVPGATVNFAATTSSGGATALLSAPSAQTNSAGIASVTATANNTPGSYQVQASVAGVGSPATFPLGNIPNGYAVGDMLASISGPDETETTRTVASYLNNGKSFVLLDISASWCHPSTQAQPDIKTALASLASRGVSVKLVTLLLQGQTQGTASTQSDAVAWHNQFTDSSVLHADGNATGSISTAGRFLLGVPSEFPTTMVISPQGKILDLMRGVQTAEALEGRILRFATPQVNFYSPFSLGAGNLTQGVAIGEITYSGTVDAKQPDLVLANTQDNTVSVLARNGTNDGYDAPQDYAVDSGPVAVAIGDVNGDGANDVVTANYGWTDNAHTAPGWNDTLSVLLNTTAPGFSPAQTITVGQGPFAVAIGDINGDGRDDIAVTDLGPVDSGTGLPTGNTVSVVLQNPTGAGFLSPQTYTVGGGPAGIAIGDVNGDGWPDLVTANYNSGNVSVLYGNGAGGLAPQQTLAVSTNASFPVTDVKLADVNGDGKLDIVAADPADQAVAVLERNSSNTGFDVPQRIPVPAYPTGLAVGDLNGDGRPDIVTADTYNPFNGDPGTTVTELLRNASNTGFDAPIPHTVGSGPVGPAVGDLNGDGKLDIVTSAPASPSTTITALYGSYDHAAPAATDNVPKAWLEAPPKVTLTAKDTGGLLGTPSGVAAIRYLIGTHPGDPRKAANHPLTYDPAHKPVLKDGERIAYSAIDNAGNVEPERISPPAHVVTDAQIKSVLSGEIAPAGSAARIPAILSNDGFTFASYKLPAAGTAVLSWAHSQGGKSTTVATGELTMSTNGTGKLTAKLTAAGKALLKSSNHLPELGTATFTTPGRPAVSVSRSFTLTS